MSDDENKYRKLRMIIPFSYDEFDQISGLETIDSIPSITSTFACPEVIAFAS